MDIKKLAEEIIAGRRLKRGEDLTFFIDCDMDELCESADKIRKHFVGDRVDLCTITNGRSGRCPEDCKYCAQSSHYDTDCKIYDFVDEEILLEQCKKCEQSGADKFSIVTAGKALTGEEFEKALHAFKRMKEECDIELCASMGFLNDDQLKQLVDIGVNRYHHNIETSKRYFPEVCTTHTYEQKFDTLYRLKEAGMIICSGGIIGMGENWEDRIDMAVSLSEVGVDSIPLNMLMPIKGTPYENMPPISEEDVLRTVAIFRFINPESDVRLAAGRACMSEDGKKAFESGASATITGNMLTTAAKATIESDREMLTSMGRKVK